MQDVVQDREWLKKPPNGLEGHSVKISTVQRHQPRLIEAFNSTALAKEAKKADVAARKAAKAAALTPGKGQSTIREVSGGFGCGQSLQCETGCAVGSKDWALKTRRHGRVVRTGTCPAAAAGIQKLAADGGPGCGLLQTPEGSFPPCCSCSPR